MTLFDADFRGPGIPWIDPLDESKANVIARNNGFKSRQQIIREGGGDPTTVDEEIATDGFTPPATETADDDGTALETEQAAAG